MAASGQGADAVDPAIRAWWAALHADAVAAGRVPTALPTFDVTISPPSSVQEAINRCTVGGSILLLPGVYEGGIVLSKEVHLYGRGEALLRCAAKDGPVITSTAAAATVDGLIARFDSRSCSPPEGYPIISIDGSCLLLRHCDVSGALSGAGTEAKFTAGIEIEGSTSRPTILGCRVHDCSNGIAFYPGSGGVVMGCNIVACNDDGIFVSDADPTLRANHIHSGAGDGVSFTGKRAKARLEGNIIWEMGGNGVNILDGANPELTVNKIHVNLGTGVFVKSAYGILLGNTIRGNNLAGVWVRNGGDPTLVDNTIRDHIRTQGFGVVIETSALGNVVWGDGNVFSGNKVAALGGMEAESDAAPADAAPAVAATAAAAPQAATPTDAHLLRELECIVCKDIMLRPYIICHEGHASACMPCYDKLKACPGCRGKLLAQPGPVRNLPLEGLAQDLFVPCPFTADGCPLNALRYAEAGAHVDKCDWRKARVSLKLAPMYVHVLFCFACFVNIHCSRREPLARSMHIQ